MAPVSYPNVMVSVLLTEGFIATSASVQLLAELPIMTAS